MYDTFPTGTWRDTTELLGEKKEEKNQCISHTATISISYTTTSCFYKTATRFVPVGYYQACGVFKTGLVSCHYNHRSMD
jgi:hypothetical protein